MSKSELLKKLNNKEKVYGTLVCIGDTAVTEAISLSGFDLIWIDCEHSLISGSTLQNTLISAKAGGTPAWVRVPWNDPVLAKPVLDMGADGIIFPYIRSIIVFMVPEPFLQIRKRRQLQLPANGAEAAFFSSKTDMDSSPMTSPTKTCSSSGRILRESISMN